MSGIALVSRIHKQPKGSSIDSRRFQNSKEFTGSGRPTRTGGEPRNRTTIALASHSNCSDSEQISDSGHFCAASRRFSLDKQFAHKILRPSIDVQAWHSICLCFQQVIGTGHPVGAKKLDLSCRLTIMFTRENFEIVHRRR